VRLRRVEPILRRALRGECRVRRGRAILVAVSGGADSVAMLVGLHNLAPELGLELSAAHLHHGLRGAEASRDLAFVRALCRRLEVPLQARRIAARQLMRERGLAGQSGLRTLRREFLIEAARACGAAAIATAHTADDQLETVLMRIGRGTGLAGLGGIRPRRGGWIRPLLLATRADVERDLNAAHQGWREDRSNADPAYLRNRIRHLALPALARAIHGEGLEAGTDRLARHASRAAAEVQGAERILRRQAERALSRLVRIQEEEFALDVRGVAAYPAALQRSMLRQLWTRLAPTEPGLTLPHLSTLQRLLTTRREGARVGLPGGWTARIERSSLAFRRQAGEGESRNGVAGPASRGRPQRDAREAGTL